MEFEEIIRKREAVRKFKDVKISEEDLNKILEAGRLAPTAKNNQPIKIFVIESEEAMAKIDSVTPCRCNAPISLLVCGDKKEAWTKDNFDSAVMDASIVTTHMMLEATNLGIDNIWVEAFNTEDTKKAFKLDENIIPVCLLPLGYRTDDYAGNPLHNKRKDLEELVKFI